MKPRSPLFVTLAFVFGLSTRAQPAPGDVDALFNPAPDSTVRNTTMQPDGKMILGGAFSSVAGSTRNMMARFNADGTLDTGFNPNIGGNVPTVHFSVVQADGKILIGGDFLRVGGVDHRSLARLNANGSLDTTFPFVTEDQVVSAAVQQDGRILLGGPFFTMGGVTRTHLARLNTNNTLDPAFTPSTNETVFNITVQPDGRILIGGGFTQVNGTTRNSIARLSTSGSLDSAFNPNVNDTVFAIVIQPDGKVVIGGTFTRVGTVTRNYMARLNPDGSLDTAFNPNFGPVAPNAEQVFSIALQTDGKFIVAGNFTSVGGVARNRIVRLNTDGTLDTTFSPSGGANSLVYDATLTNGGAVFTGGVFTTIGGQTRRFTAKLENDAAVQSLTIPGQSRVQWLRGGTSPESLQTTFELSTNGGGGWVLIGSGTRIAGGWELTGINLPRSGQIRARARYSCGIFNASSSLVETVQAFAFIPEISIYKGDSVAAPALSKGQPEAVDFGVTRQGQPVSMSFTISNTGTADLRISGLTLPAGFNSNLTPPPVVVGINQSRTFQVQLNAVSPGIFTGSLIMASDDPDESTFDFPITGKVITPEIAVHQGADSASPELTDHQETAFSFGTVRQAFPQTRTLTIANIGTAPLLINSLFLPTGFTALDLPVLPVTIPAEGFLTFRIRLDAAAPGTFMGTVLIGSDDLDEAVFDFPVTGTVITPEIAVHNGDNASTAELSDGQAAAVDFGRNIQGTPRTRNFTIANAGTAELLVSSVTVPPGYTALNVPALPLTLGTNQAITFQISLTTLTVDTHSGSVIIESDDVDEALFDFPLTGEVFIPEPVGSVVSTTTILNRQTGLREQTIHITNDTTATVPAYNLIIRGLPAGVEVNNASGTRADGSVVVYIRQSMAPGSSQDIVIEYYSPNRAPAEINPQLSTEVILVPPYLTVPAGDAGFAIDRLARLPGGEMLIEFTSVPGRHYQMQFSVKGRSWQSSLPAIRAAANRTQWIDRGIPRTDSHPAQSAGRLYRVKELTP